MYTVMLIDDDVPMLDYMAHLLGELDLKLELVASAATSKEALEKFARLLPDLVITDIGLPGMNGLELAQAFRDRKPEVRLIFLTCYEDFHYSKRALQLEADDYLIKDELSIEQLALSIGKSVRRLDSRQEVIEKYSAHQDLERNRDLLRQAFLQDVMRGKNAEEQRRYGERLGISWPHPLFRLGFLQLDGASVQERYRPEDGELLTYGMYNIACELGNSAAGGRITVFQSRECGILAVWNGEGELADGRLWSAAPGEPAAGEGAQELAGFLRQVQEKTARFLRLEASGGYWPEAVALERLGEAFRHLVGQREGLFYSGTPQILRLSGGELYSAGEERFDRERELIRLGFAEGSTAWFDLAAAGIQERALASRLVPSPLKSLLANMVRQAAYEREQAVDEAFVRSLSGALRLEEAVRLIRAELRRLLARIEAERNTPQARDLRLQEIDQYLEGHPGEMVTSLEMAELLHLNPSYFSRYFKRLAGVNFTDYVNRHKIEMAIQLLSRENETVENVAYTLGFSDRAYFSKVFKKYSGKNPSEYKAGLR